VVDWRAYASRESVEIEVQYCSVEKLESNGNDNNDYSTKTKTRTTMVITAKELLERGDQFVPSCLST